MIFVKVPNIRYLKATSTLSQSVIKILLLEGNQLMGKLPLEILRREDEGTQNILSSYLAMLVPLCLEKDFRELGLSE